MKAVLINSWYIQYSTGKLVRSFHNHLVSKMHDVKVFYGHGNKFSKNNVYKITSNIDLYMHALLCRISGFEGCFSTNATKKLIKEIDSFSPDVVYLFNLHAYYLNEYMLLEYLKKKQITVVYMLFDEYPYLGKCCFAGNCQKYKSECKNCTKKKEYPASLFFDQSNKLFKRKRDIFNRWEDLTLAGVEFLKNEAKQSVIAKNVDFEVLDMGVELNKTYYPRKCEELRKNLNIKESSKIVITVGMYSDERKGIKKLVEIAKLCKNDDITFINIGFDGNKNELPENFIGIGYVYDQDELAMYYSLADIYVMTSSGEAMSLTCMEALGCGTKLIGFNISGTPYSTSERFGTFVKFNDLEDFASAIRNTEKKSEQSIQECREYALSRYEISDFTMNLENIGLEKLARKVNKK